VLTQQVGDLPLARVPNDPPADRASDGRGDYRGDFDPGFTLGALSTPMLGAVQEEFVVQTHLLAAAGELALAMRFGDDDAQAMMASGFVGVGWITGARLAKALGLGDEPGASGVAAALTHQAMLPPGFARDVTVDGDAVQLVLTAAVDGLLDPAHPGVPGLLARGDRGGLLAMAQAVDPRARLAVVDIAGGALTAAFTVAPGTEPVGAPGEAALMESRASDWEFSAGA
jgi:hypothetical protein